MAAIGVRGSGNIPAGAVKLSEEEALKIQTNLVRDWPRQSEVMFLRYSHFIASAAGVISSITISRHFSNLFNLASSSRFSLQFPSVLIGSSMPFLHYQKHLTEEALLMNQGCPLCQQLKYTFHCFLSSIIYPTGFGLLGGSAIAMIHKTYDVPSYTENPREYYRFWWRSVKQGAFKFQIVTGMHLFLILFLPYMQSREIVNVTENVKRMSYNENLEENEFISEFN